MSRSREMTREQEKAMWAKRRGGGGGGGGGGRSGGGSSGGSSRPSAPAYKSGARAAWEGAVGGATIAANALTFGAIDSLSRAADSYVGTEYDVSRGLASGSRELLITATGAGLISRAGAAYNASKLALTGFGKALKAHSGLATAISGFAAKNEIDAHREGNPDLNPLADKGLGVASTLAGYVGTTGAVGATLKYGKAGLGAIPIYRFPGTSHLAGQKVSLGDAGTYALQGLDRAFGAAGGYIKSLGNKVSPWAMNSLGKAHSAYTKTSDFTGATIKDLSAGFKPGAGMLDKWKSGYVAGGIAGVSGADEYTISKYGRMQADALETGESFELPGIKKRSTLARAVALAAGTTGNPVEKLFRPGREQNLAEHGIYRENLRALERAYESGRISGTDYERDLAALRDNRPFKSEGNALWQFAPAMAGYGNWKVGEAMADERRSDYHTVTRNYDGDTLFTDKGPSGGLRFLDMNAPELKDTGYRIGAEWGGQAAADRMAELAPPGSTIRVVSDSNRKASGVDKYGRMMATVETAPGGQSWLYDIPVVRGLVPGRDANETMIREGLADIHYRHLSGKTDRASRYDAAREEAQAEERGIWSAEGVAQRRKNHLDWVGTEKTREQRFEDYFRRATGNAPPPTPYGDAMKWAGSGMMFTGNSGLFNYMPRSGQAIMQAWNAGLAYGGVKDYDERQARSLPRNNFVPKSLTVQSEYRRKLDAMAAELGLR